MGEILRAVLDATALHSAPAFYGARISTTAVLAAGRTFQTREVTLQCKADTWFLMMGWTQDIAVGATDPLWNQKTFPSQFVVRDVRTSELLARLQIMHSNAGYNLNNMITLPHYQLWPPSSLIGVSMECLVENSTATVPIDTFVTLAGIEYKMPAGKG